MQRFNQQCFKVIMIKKGENMKEFTDTYNVVVGAFIAIMTAIFGVYWYIFVAYMILNVMDWLTGLYK